MLCVAGMTGLHQGLSGSPVKGPCGRGAAQCGVERESSRGAPTEPDRTPSEPDGSGATPPVPGRSRAFEAGPHTGCGDRT